MSCAICYVYLSLRPSEGDNLRERYHVTYYTAPHLTTPTLKIIRGRSDGLKEGYLYNIL